MSEDESNLNSLALAHYIVGGVMALFSCMPLIHMTVGLFILIGEESFMFEEGEDFPSQIMGWMFFLIGLLCFLVGQVSSILIIVSGRFIKKRKKRIFSFFMACVACLGAPLGTILGVFTIIVLSRDSVKRIYGEGEVMEYETAIS